jgi:hypothetical protein
VIAQRHLAPRTVLPCRGETEAEALANAIAACLEARQANGMPLTVSTREVEVGVSDAEAAGRKKGDKDIKTVRSSVPL